MLVNGLYLRRTRAGLCTAQKYQILSTHWRRRRYDERAVSSRLLSTTRSFREDIRPSGSRRQDAQPDSNGKSPEAGAEVPPESATRPSPAKPAKPQDDPLLGGQLVSNKEQRKADWAIMKEMTRYLWPKVPI